VPYEQQANEKYLNLYVRTSGDMARATDNVRAAIAAVDRDVALFEVRTVTAQVDALLAVERSVAALAVSFGSIGAALAALGVYGVLAFLVTTRRREIGIRMALGAAPSAIVRQTMAEAGRALAGGALLGLAIAIVVARSARTFLYGVQPIDLSSFVSSILIVSVIVAAAAALPARRAARLDPTTALREE
jgi:putative ABC transport system permease protein